MERIALECQNVSIVFKNFMAVKKFNLKVNQGQIYGLIGPNGAGKTTIFNLLTNVYKPSSGEILLNGKIARTFQNIRLFKKMTVLENLLVGFHNNQNYSLFETILRLPRYFKEEFEIKQKAIDLLSIFEMQNMADLLAENLPYGAQRRLEILRALATNPSVLLLDEPAAGMNSSETSSLLNAVLKIKKLFEISIIIIEHDIKFIADVCDRVCVLNHGEVIADATPREIQNSEAVIEAYLGRPKC